MLKNKTFNCSSGEQLRNFIYIDDVVKAIFKLIKSSKSKGQIFNIGSGKPIKVKNVIEKIKKISKGGIPLYGKIKIRKEINWRPNIPFDKGLKSIIKFYKDNFFR